MILRKSSPMNDSVDDPVPDSAKLIKLEAGTRSAVQFKPSKRMKKRRQLDALVGNDVKKLPRRKHSAHELLRSNDSGSSEIEEFGIIHGHKVEKSWTSSCCFTCYSLTCALVMTICVLACASLIWMHLQLKRDFNDLKDRLRLVENRNAATPEDMQAVQTKLNQIDKSLGDIRSGKSGIQNLNKSIVSMQAQITSLMAAQQQQTLETSSSDNHEDVAKTVAELGSDVHSAMGDVNTLKNAQTTLSNKVEDLDSRVTALESPAGGREGVAPGSDTEGLQTSIAEINSTLSQAVASAVNELNTQKSRIEVLSHVTQGLQDQVNGIQQLALGLNQSQQSLLEALTQDSDADLAQLQNQVNDLQQLLEKGLVLLHLMPSGEGNGTKSNSSSGLSPSSPSSSADDDAFSQLLTEHEEFMRFKAEVYQDLDGFNASLSSMNGSVGVLRRDMGDLSTRVAVASGNITSIAAVVKEVVSFMHSHDLNTGGNSATKAPKSSDLEGGEAHRTTSAP